VKPHLKRDNYSSQGGENKICQYEGLRSHGWVPSFAGRQVSQQNVEKEYVRQARRGFLRKKGSNRPGRCSIGMEEGRKVDTPISQVERKESREGGGRRKPRHIKKGEKELS